MANCYVILVHGFALLWALVAVAALGYSELNGLVSTNDTTLLLKPISRKVYENLFGTKMRKLHFNSKETSQLSASPTERYYEQSLDHFGDSPKTWKQRYWINNEYFDRHSGPVFLFIGGEDQANPDFLSYGMMAQLGKHFKALCVLLEHRFYGKSFPTKDLSVENLSYLNKDQALEDLASFRNFVHQSNRLTSSNKWISFGGSYPGSLSAWFRLKYPHLVHAAYSSSAPIKSEANFFEYLQVVSYALDRHNKQCPLEIKKATTKLNELMKTSSGRSTIQKLFKLCGDLENRDDVTLFYMLLHDTWKIAVQNDPNDPSMKKLCDMMLDKKVADPLARLAATFKTLASDNECISCEYSNLVSSYQLSKLDLKGESWSRQWMYQSCFEFGFFQTTDSSKQPFGSELSLSDNLKMCQDIFGQRAFKANELMSKIKSNNELFGGNGHFEGSRVIFTNGEIDPWSALGFTGNGTGAGIESFFNNRDIITIFIKGASHTSDFSGYSEQNSPQLNQAFARTKSILSQWLSIK